MASNTRILLASTALVLTCAGSVGSEPLPGSEWVPVELAGAPFEQTSGKEVFLQFRSDGLYFGNGGCNSVRGSFVVNGDAILFGPGAATMMACPEPAMKTEISFFQVISLIRAFERDGTTLSLFDAEGSIVLRMQQRDTD
ncbi:MAG: META domain-containing protein [Pseudomonadota bacterium]